MVGASGAEKLGVADELAVKVPGGVTKCLTIRGTQGAGAGAEGTCGAPGGNCASRGAYIISERKCNVAPELSW